MHNHVIHRLARCHTLMDYYSLRFQYKDQTAICCYNVVVSMTKRGGRVNGDGGADKSGVVRPRPAVQPRRHQTTLMIPALGTRLY